MRRARSSFPHFSQGPRTYPLIRYTWMTLAGEDTLSLVMVSLAGPAPPLGDLFLSAEVALRAHVIEDRVVPVGVLDEELLLGAALLAVLLLLPDLLPAEHWRDEGITILKICASIAGRCSSESSSSRSSPAPR